MPPGVVRKELALSNELLNVVLAKVAVAGVVGGPKPLVGLTLRYRDQRHFIGGATASRTGVRDPALYRLQVLVNV